MQIGFKSPMLCLAVSGAFGVSVGSIPALSDTQFAVPLLPALANSLAEIIIKKSKPVTWE